MWTDFSKTHDKLLHGRLLCKFRSPRSSEIAKSTQNWFDGRKCTMMVEDCFMNRCPLISVMHQGLVLVPLLFVININDLVESESMASKFANDTKIDGVIDSVKKGPDPKCFSERPSDPLSYFSTVFFSPRQ